MKTKYAPAERDPRELVNDDFNLIKSIEYIEKLINSLPYLGAILNDKRQIVFANRALLDMFELSDIEFSLGFRPGELASCIYVDPLTGGCGTSQNCSVCGAVNCILEAQRSNKRVVKECRITSNINDEQKSFDFKVTTTPLEWGDKKLYVFSLVDIGDEKRRKALEKIFFHDVINKTGSMYGFIDLLKIEKNPERIKQFIHYISLINNDLTDEILSQRDLLSAENGELKVNSEKVNSLSIVETSKNQIVFHPVSIGKFITLDIGSESFDLITDAVLLRRMLMNMLKNALEASQTSDTVKIGCNQTKDSFRFWTQNNSIMPNEIKFQVFQRSFSTKGLNRGLGTYSIKLLGEKYLKGKVGFTSTEPEGTIFYIDLPR